ncbi:MAG: PHA/PHB synthase family protein [Acidimicrobiales bacterium]
MSTVEHRPKLGRRWLENGRRSVAPSPSGSPRRDSVGQRRHDAEPTNDGPGSNGSKDTSARPGEGELARSAGPGARPGSTRHARAIAETAQALAEELAALDEAVDGMLPLSAMAMTPSQAAAAAARLIQSLVTQPTVISRHLTNLFAQQWRINAGLSEIAPDCRDRRFTDPWFTEHPLYRWLAQSYLAYERGVDELIGDLGLDPKARLRSRFLTQAVTSAQAPTNTLLGNPAAMKEAVRTNGRSLADGARHAVHDLNHNGGLPSMVDTRPFVLGETVAVTPGEVVYANDILELIQYRPTTRRVFSRPLVVVPPQINKYYILDLAPGRSMVEYLVGRGQQVFMVSWRNPGPEDRDWNLDSYLSAVMNAVEAAQEITGSPNVNLAGVCAGGVTSAALAGHLAATGDDRVNTATFVVTVLDWDAPSTMGSFVSRPTMDAAVQASRRSGVLPGDELTRLFAWMRPNDLIWNYWVNNYLMGRNPPAFDVLAWNVDAANLPAALHEDFAALAAGNTLMTPGAQVALGTPLDLGDVTCDTFVVGAVTDHITPWKACYSTVNAIGGRAEFVLSSQGHVQALVNPEKNPKGTFYVNPEAVHEAPIDADQWLEDADPNPGSWWEYWSEWLSSRSGAFTDAPVKLGSDAHPTTFPAPGTYVLD